MRLWIDLANSPHVPFFKALAKRFVAQGHEVETTAREFAETVPLARAAGFTPEVVGGPGGRDVAEKGGRLVSRGETVPLARAAGFTPEVVGGHGGRDVSKKAGSLISRAWSLAGWARKRKFDL